MNLYTRKHYIDNLRWMILLILIPYHTAMAWNTWGEPNYIFFEGNRLISSIVVFFSPYFMPLLFVLAGISAHLALQKRTLREYLIERVKRLLIPFLFGTIALMPAMSYIGDRLNYSYDKGFLQHYMIFFTKYTDLTGADGGFSVGQFWFLLYLFIISIINILIFTLFPKAMTFTQKAVPLRVVLLLGLPLPIISGWLSMGGKSIIEYMYLFLIGYYIFSDDNTINNTEKNSLLLLGFGITASVLNAYLFLWKDKEYVLLNTLSKYVSEWIMIIAFIGLAKKFLNFSGKISNYMQKRGFLFYIYHFIWVVTFQYLLFILCGKQTIILFAGSIILSYLFTLITCEISMRIPLLCFLTGTKNNLLTIKKSS